MKTIIYTLTNGETKSIIDLDDSMDVLEACNTFVVISNDDKILAKVNCKDLFNVRIQYDNKIASDD